MNWHQLKKYIECDADFQITPCQKKDKKGNAYTDWSCFLFTPKTALENGRNYILTFKKGIPSQNGTFLEKTCYRTITIAQKPKVLKTYPSNGDKWIGLYPRFMLTADQPIREAYLKLNGKTIQAKVQNEKQAYFTLPELLMPDATYEAFFQTSNISGEKSIPQKITFSTTSLEKDRIWLIVRLQSPHQVECYKGSQQIKSFPCIIGKDKNSPLLGTYYIQNKQEVYESQHIGANYYLEIYENFGFQGMMRNSYWQLETGLTKQMGGTSDYRNIILKDEDARWLYEIPHDTMVVIIN